ncbi:hypothetical protein K432DRAFT_309410 [Lepidopterella palustris CBS 459.81]|uniref:Geranylgeranyl pyrophosphate synthetase n=1 Tax=Lepidopterella palustris CBS 459.81 TaxID=1314670 RepID=A0A8E2E0K6_9PEZI|nr:hypothetical protein K432DRAFT_309410 [Lepidopterella palustris CBS 459.81]
MDSHQTVTNPLGPLLLSLSNADLTPTTDTTSSPPSITDCEYAVSYSWMNTTNPTILVPGKPPAWTPLNGPQQLDEDRDEYFRDPNAARFPKYPTEPAVRALLTEQPNYDTTEIDIFACGSTLGNLLRFVRNVYKAFRFNVEVIGNTVFFVRKENSPTELIKDVHGYGHSFPEKYTTWEPDVKGSKSNQRIVKYKFGGLDCMVRFESDGYHKDLVSRHATREPTSDMTQDPESLIDALTSTAVGNHVPVTEQPLEIKSGGCEIPQNAIFDLKTRSNRRRKEINMDEIYPRLWVAHIPNFIVAYHNGDGLFQDIRRENIRRELDNWEKENEIPLRSLVVLIHKIIAFAKATPDAKLEIYRVDPDRLEIRKQEGEGSDALLAHLKAIWAKGPKVPEINAAISTLREEQESLNRRAPSDDDDFYRDDHDEDYNCQLGQ